MSDSNGNNNIVEELDLNEILKVRREKLKELQESVQIPFRSLNMT